MARRNSMSPISDHSTENDMNDSKKSHKQEKTIHQSLGTQEKKSKGLPFIKNCNNLKLFKALSVIVIGILLISFVLILLIFIKIKFFSNNDLFFVDGLPSRGGLIQFDKDYSILKSERENIQNTTPAAEKKENENNASTQVLIEEINALRKILIELHNNYNNLLTRLKKTENLIANPLKNTNIQRIISLLILKNKMDKGEYFLLNKKITEESSVLEPCTAVLLQFSNIRIPTSIEIFTQFSKVSEEIIFASETLEKDSGFTNYLLLQLNKLIKIRPLGGDVEGDTITALVARIENNLRKGDLRSAAIEWDKIPEKTRKPGIFLRNALEAHICSDSIIKAEMSKISQDNLS